MMVKKGEKISVYVDFDDELHKVITLNNSFVNEDGFNEVGVKFPNGDKAYAVFYPFNKKTKEYYGIKSKAESGWYLGEGDYLGESLNKKNKMSTKNLKEKILTKKLEEATGKKVVLKEMFTANFAFVTAQSFDRETGKEVGKSRTEKIDLKTNRLFSNCKSILDIHDAYESFWNKLNSNSNLVFVSKIVLG